MLLAVGSGSTPGFVGCQEPLDIGTTESDPLERVDAMRSVRSHGKVAGQLFLAREPNFRFSAPGFQVTVRCCLARGWCNRDILARCILRAASLPFHVSFLSRSLYAWAASGACAFMDSMTSLPSFTPISMVSPSRMVPSRMPWAIRFSTSR